MNTKACLVILLLCNVQLGNAQESVTPATISAEQTFQYIASTLQAFRRSGQIAPELGLDGANYQPFIDVLQSTYVRFTEGFGADSAMCQFYLDPENSRMTIEDRAGLAFSFLQDLASRNLRYASLDEAFQSTIKAEFGGAVLSRIVEMKQGATNNQRLPSSNFDEAARINFADAMCV